MANVYATKSGLWSDTTVWNTGALPTTIDDVYTNAFTVTANTNTRVATIRNGSTSGISAGGTVILANGISLSATLASSNSTQTTQVLMTLAPAATATITGSPALFNNIPGSATLAPLLSCPIGTATTINTTPTSYLFVNINQTVIYNNSSNLVINGNVGLNGGNTASRFVDQSSTSSAKTTFNGNLSSSGGSFSYLTLGQIVVNGNVFDTSVNGSIPFQTNNSSTVFTVVGNVSSSSTGTAASGYCFMSGAYSTPTVSITGNVGSRAIFSQNASWGKINIKGNVIASHATCLNAAGASDIHTVSIQGDVIASNLASACYAANTSTLSLTGNITNAPNGRQAIVYPKVFVSPGSSATYTRHAVNGYDSYVDYWTSNATLTYPASSDVVLNTTYKNNTLSGSMAIPSASSVALGAPVGTTTGTASVTIDNILNQPIANLTTSNSIGARLKNITTSQALSSIANSLNFTN